MISYGELLGSTLRVHEIGARRSGRTERMLQTLPDRATVICLTQREADRLQHHLRSDHGRDDVDFIVCGEADLNLAHDRLGRRRFQGAVIFDHSWEQQFWAGVIERTTKNLSEFVRIMHRDPPSDPRERGNPYVDFRP